MEHPDTLATISGGGFLHSDPVFGKTLKAAMHLRRFNVERRKRSRSSTSSSAVRRESMASRGGARSLSPKRRATSSGPSSRRVSTASSSTLLESVLEHAQPQSPGLTTWATFVIEVFAERAGDDPTLFEGSKNKFEALSEGSRVTWMTKESRRNV